MDYIRDIVIVIVTISGVGLVFKFLLDTLKAHLSHLEQAWRAEADRMYRRVDEVGSKLEKHIEEEDCHDSYIQKRLDALYLSVITAKKNGTMGL